MRLEDDRRPLTANDQIRANVRELMDLRRWTQADLAERLGRSQPWLSKRLTGTTPFQIEDLDTFSAAFGLKPAELLCMGFGKWDRRQTPERRAGDERRRLALGRSTHERSTQTSWTPKTDDEPAV